MVPPQGRLPTGFEAPCRIAVCLSSPHVATHPRLLPWGQAGEGDTKGSEPATHLFLSLPVAFVTITKLGSGSCLESLKTPAAASLLRGPLCCICEGQHVGNMSALSGSTSPAPCHSRWHLVTAQSPAQVSPASLPAWLAHPWPKVARSSRNTGATGSQLPSQSLSLSPPGHVWLCHVLERPVLRAEAVAWPCGSAGRCS